MRCRILAASLAVLFLGNWAMAGQAAATREPLALPTEADLATENASALAAPAAPANSPDTLSERAAELVRRYRPNDFDLTAKARQLGSVEPVFRFVRDEIRFESYPGVLRGARGAFLNRAANAADRSLLLAELLRAIGVQCRFATGRLPDDKCLTLFGRMFESPASAATQSTETAANGAFLTRVRARARRDYRVVHAALKDKPFAAEPDHERLLHEITSHVWVQARVGTGWVDLDSAFSDAEPGKTYCPAQATEENLPDALHQKVTIRIVVERLAGGALQNETVLEATRTAVDLTGKQIFFVQAPESGLRGMGHAIAGGGKDAWLPALLIGDEIASGKLVAFNDQNGGDAPSKGGVADVLGALDTAPAKPNEAPQFVSESLEFDLTAPGEKTQTIRRILCDCGSAAWRRKLPLDPAALKPLARDERGPLDAQVIRNIWVSSGRHDPSAYAIALQALAGEEHPTNAPAAPEDPELDTSRALWPIAMQNYACTLWGDQSFLPALNDDPHVRFYLDSPRILTFNFLARVPPEAPDKLAIESETDFCRDSVRGVSLEGHSNDRIVAHKLWYAVLEGALEHELAAQQMVAITQGRGVVSSTSALLGPDGVQTFDPRPADAEWENRATDRETAARLADALAAGSVAVVPKRVLSGGVNGWWAVSANGDTRSVLDRDMGGGKFGVGGNYVGRVGNGAAGSGPSTNGVDPNTGKPTNVKKGGNEYFTIVLNVSLPGARTLSITITPALRSIVFEVVYTLL